MMSVSSRGISLSADVPASDEQYFVGKVDGKFYLSQYKLSELRKEAIGCGNDALVGATVNDSYHENHLQYNDQEHINPMLRSLKDSDSSCEDLSLSDPYTIDVLVVYTTAAKAWAAADGSVNDIDDLIDQAFLKSQLVLDNSNTNITLNIVHKYETNYVEVDNNNDLYNITTNGDGYMDEVHTLRKTYKADMVVFIPKVTFTGGLAWLNNSMSYDNAFALCRVQQSSWTYTVIHELGHNFGCAHNKDQTASAGGNGRFGYSNGWHGIDNISEKISTVMTYENYLSGGKFVNIPYFSSPDIIYNGVAIGDAEYANNALTVRRAKRATSMFEGDTPSFTARMYNYSISYNGSSYVSSSFNPTFRFTDAATTPETVLLTGDVATVVMDPAVATDAGTYKLMVKIMRGDKDVSCEYPAIFSDGSFTISQKNISAYLANKTSTYDGNKQYINPATLSGAIAGNSIVFTYEYTKDGVTTDYAQNAGVYAVVAKTDGDNNHKATTTSSVTFTINKAASTLALTPQSVSYTGNAIDFVNIVSNPSDATFTITYEGINGTIYSPSTTAPSDQGEYKVTVNFAGDSNYLPSTETSTLEIKAVTSINEADVNLRALTIIPTQVKRGDYFNVKVGSAFDLTNRATVEIYNLSGKLISKEIVDGNTILLSAPNVAGTYIIRLDNKKDVTETKLIVE